MAKRPKVTLKREDAIRIGRFSNGRIYYVFKCATQNCSNEITPSHLKRGTGYCTSCLMKKEPFGIIFRRIHENAKRKNIECSITYEQFIEFTKVTNCVYCGEVVSWVDHISSDYKGKTGYNLDRKISSLGYTKENCVVCCPICNWSKNNLFSHEEFLEIGPAIGRVLRKRRG